MFGPPGSAVDQHFSYRFSSQPRSSKLSGILNTTVGCLVFTADGLVRDPVGVAAPLDEARIFGGRSVQYGNKTRLH